MIQKSQTIVKLRWVGKQGLGDSAVENGCAKRTCPKQPKSGTIIVRTASGRAATCGSMPGDQGFAD